MFSKRIYNLVLVNKVSEFIKLYNPYAIYITGSFASNKDWLLGLSDIDLKIFTEDITDSISLVENYQSDQESLVEIPINVNVYRLREFLEPKIFKRYIEEGEAKKSEIILDQLYINGINELIYGCPVKFSYIKPNYLREFAYENREYYKNRFEEGILAEELKRIIFAVRLFYFLWNGEYIYDLEELLKKINDVGWEKYVIDIFNESLKMHYILKKDEGYRSFDNNYIRCAMKFRNWRRNLIGFLCDKDMVVSSGSDSNIITGEFICHKGFIK